MLVAAFSAMTQALLELLSVWDLMFHVGVRCHIQDCGCNHGTARLVESRPHGDKDDVQRRAVSHVISLRQQFKHDISLQEV